MSSPSPMLHRGQLDWQGSSAEKFVPGLVAPGDHQGRVLQQIDGYAGVYDDQVPALAPDTPSYSDASKLAKARLTRFFS